MTSRDRVEAALAHREPDRTPVFEYVLLSPLADRFLGRPYAGDGAHWAALVEERGWEAAVRQSAVDRVRLAALLGHDMMYLGPAPAPPAKRRPAAPGPAPSDDPVENVRRRNESAAAPLAAVPSGPDDRFIIFEFAREEMRRLDLDLPILAAAYVHGVWTDVDLMQTMVLDPPTAHRHFELATESALRLVDRYIDLNVEQVGVGGDFAGNRPLISPEAYRDFIVPEVRRLSRRVHEAGRVAVNASDGNLWSVIDDFLIATEVDGYLEIDLHAGMDLHTLKRTHGDRITFFGNLDCGNILSFGSPEDVRAHTLDCLDAGAGRGGHILCASNAITASVPLENYLAVVNAHRDRFKLPRLAPSA